MIQALQSIGKNMKAGITRVEVFNGETYINGWMRIIPELKPSAKKKAIVGHGEKELLEVLKLAGLRGLTERELSRTKMKGLSGGRLEKLIEDSIGKNLVFYVKMKTGGRDRQAWIHKDFLRIHNPNAAYKLGLMNS